MAQTNGDGDSNPQTAVNDQFISKIKSSVQWDDSFNTGLACIPTTIAPLAKTNMYAALPATASAPMEKVLDQAKFKNEHSLGACLETVVNACVTAFDKAEVNFGGISTRADDVFNTLANDIFPGLQEMETEPTPKALAKLKNAMDDLKTMALAAKDHTTEVSQEFDHVLDLSMSLRQSTVDLANISTDGAKQAQLQAYATAQKVQGEEVAVSTASATLEQNKGILDDVRERYKRPATTFQSTGTMQVMGASIAMSLTDCITNTITQVVPMLVQNMTAAGQVEGGVQAAEKTGIDITKTVKGPDSSDPSSSPPVENPVAPTTVDYANDAGYLLAPLDKPTLTHLATLATSGDDGGINWSEVDESNANASDPTAISYVINQLQSALGASSLTDKPPSEKLKGVLNKALDTAKAIQSAVKDAKSLSSTSDTVKGWQNDILDASKKLATLCTTANSNPGTGGAVGATYKPISTASNASATTSAAKSLLDGATANLHEQQAALNSALTNYTNASKSLEDDQAQLGKMKADLLTWQQNARTLNEVVAILTLVNCTLLDFKTEINKLVLHFSALAELVNMVVDDKMNTFLKDLQTEVQDSEDNAAKGGLGGITVSSLALQTFYTAACTLAAYFDLFGDVTSMYVTVSQNFISNTGGGLALVSSSGESFPTSNDAQPPSGADLSKGPDATGADYSPEVQAEIQKRLGAIDTWTTATISSIKSVLQTKHDKAQDKMNAHLKSLEGEMEKDENRNNLLLAHIKEGQKQGAQAVTNAAKTGLENTVLLSSIPNVGRSEGAIDVGASKAHRGS